MNNDQPEHLNGLCRSALHYLCLIKAFVTKFNFERVEEVHGIGSIDSRLLHYLHILGLSQYLFIEFVVGKARKFTKNSIQSIIPQKLTETFGN